MSRPRSRSVRTLVRMSLCSRLEHELLERAYELALPIMQRRIAATAQRSARPQLRSFRVPSQRVGG